MAISNVMPMLCALIALCLCGRAASQIVKSGPCPKTEAMKDFDMSKILGKWHAQETTSSKASIKSIKCLTYNLAIGSNNSVEMTVTHIDRKKGTAVSRLADVRAPDSSRPGELHLKAATDSHETEFLVLDTDYTTFAVFYTCMSSSTKHHIALHGWTRDANADPAAIAKIHKHFEPLGLKESDMHKIKQTECVLRPDA